MKFVFIRPEPKVRQRIIKQIFIMSRTYITGFLPMSLSYKNDPVCSLKSALVKISLPRSYPNLTLLMMFFCVFLTVVTDLQTNGLKINFNYFSSFSVIFVASLQTSTVTIKSHRLDSTMDQNAV